MAFKSQLVSKILKDGVLFGTGVLLATSVSINYYQNYDYNVNKDRPAWATVYDKVEDLLSQTAGDAEEIASIEEDLDSIIEERDAYEQDVRDLEKAYQELAEEYNKLSAFADTITDGYDSYAADEEQAYEDIMGLFDEEVEAKSFSIDGIEPFGTVSSDKYPNAYVGQNSSGGYILNLGNGDYAANITAEQYAEAVAAGFPVH